MSYALRCTSSGYEYDIIPWDVSIIVIITVLLLQQGKIPGTQVQGGRDKDVLLILLLYSIQRTAVFYPKEIVAPMHWFEAISSRLLNLNTYVVRTR